MPYDYIPGSPTAILTGKEFMSQQVYKDKAPPFSPQRYAFWRDYGFTSEGELDAFLTRYAVKLKNFDWQNALQTVLNVINKNQTVYTVRGTRYTIPLAQLEEAKSLHQMEYQFLGPIKYALKYDRWAPVVWNNDYSIQVSQYTTWNLNRNPANYPSIWDPALKPGLASAATTRNTLIFHLYDGTKLQAISKGVERKEVVAGKYVSRFWYIPLLEILQIARMPNVVAIEASDALYSQPLGATVDSVKLWNDVRGLINQNYVKYMSQPGGPSTTHPPSTGPTTPSAGAPPTAPTGQIASKTWLWVAAGVGGLVLLWVLLKRG
jgi:hypothetical protein